MVCHLLPFAKVGQYSNVQILSALIFSYVRVLLIVNMDVIK